MSKGEVAEAATGESGAEGEVILASVGSSAVDFNGESVSFGKDVLMSSIAVSRVGDAGGLDLLKSGSAKKAEFSVEERVVLGEVGLEETRSCGLADVIRERGDEERKSGEASTEREGRGGGKKEKGKRKLPEQAKGKARVNRGAMRGREECTEKRTLAFLPASSSNVAWTDIYLPRDGHGHMAWHSIAWHGTPRGGGGNNSNNNDNNEQQTTTTAGSVALLVVTGASNSFHAPSVACSAVTTTALQRRERGRRD